MYTSYTRPYDDINHPGVLLFGMASIPHTNRYGGSIVLSPKIGIWQPQFTTGIDWFNSHATSIGITQNWNEPRFYFIFDNSFSFPKGWFFNIKGELAPGAKQSYAIWKTEGRVDAQLTKSFLKDQALKVSLTAKDIFHRSRSKRKVTFVIRGFTKMTNKSVPSQERLTKKSIVFPISSFGKEEYP